MPTECTLCSTAGSSTMSPIGRSCRSAGTRATATDRREMRLSNIVRLYRVRLRSRIVQELFAVLGIAIGVALLFSSQVAGTSLDGAVRQLTAGIVGQMRFQITARDAHGFDASLLSEVQRIPGVLTAVPVLQESANVVGPQGKPVGRLGGHRTSPRVSWGSARA